MADDPATEAVMRQCLAALDPEAETDALSYEEVLYGLQDTLTEMMQRSPEDEPSAEEQQAVAEALGQVHPRANDHLIGHGERLQRLRACVDVDLSRWTSAPVQPIGPSGVTAVVERPPEPEPVEPDRPGRP